MNLMHLWGQMGWFAKGVVIVMAIMSIYSLTIVFTKAVMFSRSAKATRKFMPEFSRAIQEEQLEQAIKLAETYKKSHVARVLGEALAEVKPLLRDRATITSADINSAERAVERQMLLVLSELRRGLSVLATTGATWNVFLPGFGNDVSNMGGAPNGTIYGLPGTTLRGGSFAQGSGGSGELAGVYAIDQNGAPNSIGDATAAGFRCAK